MIILISLIIISQARERLKVKDQKLSTDEYEYDEDDNYNQVSNKFKNAFKKQSI